VGSLNDLARRIRKNDPYAFGANPYGSIPVSTPSYTGPRPRVDAPTALAVGSLAATGFGATAVRNARRLPVRAQIASDDARAAFQRAEAGAKAARQASSRQTAAAAGMSRLNPKRPKAMSQARKMQQDAKKAREGAKAAGMNATRRAAELPGVPVRQRKMYRMGAGGLAAGAGLMGASGYLTWRNRRQA
jgi:hypothetical protein